MKASKRRDNLIEHRAMAELSRVLVDLKRDCPLPDALDDLKLGAIRSEEHTPELQSLMRISYAVFCLKKKNRDTKAKRRTHAKLTKHIMRHVLDEPIDLQSKTRNEI